MSDPLPEPPALPTTCAYPGCATKLELGKGAACSEHQDWFDQEVADFYAGIPEFSLEPA